MKKKVTIPENYSDITLEQLQRVRSLDGNEAEVMMELINILAGIPSEDVYAMREVDRHIIVDELTKSLENTPKEHQRQFTLKGVNYGFIPNVDTMTYGEFIDLENYGWTMENMHKTMAILYRPITKTFNQLYEIEPYSGTGERAEIFKQMPASIIFGSQLFFCRIANRLYHAILKSLQEGEKINQDSVKNGDGTRLLLNSLEMMSNNLQTLQHYHFNNALPYLRIKLTDNNKKNKHHDVLRNN